MPQGKKRTRVENKADSKKLPNKRLKVNRWDLEERCAKCGEKCCDLEITHDSHSTDQGVVLTCGNGDVGQLGLGEVSERKRFAFVDIPDPVIQVCAGGMHTVCLTSTGQVYTFGCNDDGALGRDTSADGAESSPGKVNIPAPIIMVSAGDSHTAALTNDGQVYAWGNFRDANGSMGLVVKDVIEKTPIELIQEEVIVKVASGSDHLACLTDRGELLTLGCAEQGQLGRIAECFATRGGRKGIEFVLSPGRVKVRQNKTRKMAQFSDVWTGQYMTFAKDKQNGDIYAWGLNNYFQLGHGDMINRYVPERVGWLSENGPWSMISGGQHHTVALNSQGKVYTVGRHDYGRLGLGENSEETIKPSLVPALSNFTCTNVAAGGCVSFAVTSDGSVYSWGMGSSCQLGLGDEEDQYVPVKVAGKQLESRSALMVSAGGQHAVLLASNTQNGMEH